MQKMVALLVTEAEIMARILCVQDMLYEKYTFESLELKVEFLMLLEMDNTSSVDLEKHIWSVGGINMHVKTIKIFLK